MNKGLMKRIALMGVLVALGGCTNSIASNSKIEQGPVGVGRSINQLKGTPCACTEIPMKFPANMSA